MEINFLFESEILAVKCPLVVGFIKVEWKMNFCGFAIFGFEHQ